MNELSNLVIETEECMDFSTVANGVIQGGADIVFNRFNVRTPLSLQDAKNSLINNLVARKAYFHQLETLCNNPPDFGVYFEIYSSPRISPQFSSTICNLLPGVTEEATTSLVENTIETEKKWKKVPERYECSSWRQANLAKMRWKLKEHIRKKFSSDPICHGNIVIDNNYGSTAMEYAIASRINYAGIFEHIGTCNNYLDSLKMFDSSFIVEKEKPLNRNMSAECLKSLRGHVNGIGYSFKLRNNSPLKTFAQLTKEFNYKASGFAWIEDPVFRGAKRNGSEWLDLDKLTQIPGMGGIQLVCERGNQITLDKDEFEKDEYSFSLRDLNCDKATEFMARFTSEMGRLGAKTAQRGKYSSLFTEMHSIYLPGFPMSDKTCLSLSYRGDLSAFGKN